MTTYRERREARADRLRGWADGREAKADQRLSAAKATADMIPFGQPMMPDHHSYGADRNRRDRMRSNMAKGVEHQAKADSMRSRADNIEAAAERAIYSDDPDAVERLTERIAELEAERARIKAYNASCRKSTPDETVLSAELAVTLASVRAHTPYSLGKRGELPGYVLSNLSGNIKRNRDRLAQLTV